MAIVHELAGAREVGGPAVAGVLSTTAMRPEWKKRFT